VKERLKTKKMHKTKEPCDRQNNYAYTKLLSIFLNA
jgi:hypothetical protein